MDIVVFCHDRLCLGVFRQYRQFHPTVEQQGLQIVRGENGHLLIAITLQRNHDLRLDLTGLIDLTAELYVVDSHLILGIFILEI